MYVGPLPVQVAGIFVIYEKQDEGGIKSTGICREWMMHV